MSFNYPKFDALDFIKALVVGLVAIVIVMILIKPSKKRTSKREVDIHTLSLMAEIKSDCQKSQKKDDRSCQDLLKHLNQSNLDPSNIEAQYNFYRHSGFELPPLFK